MPDPNHSEADAQSEPGHATHPAPVEPRMVLDRLWTALSGIVTLEVQTIRGGPEGAQSHSLGQRSGGLSVRPEQVVSTSINMVEGDIQTVVPTDFFEPAQAALRDYHLAQVALAREIAEGNMKAVADVIERLSGTKRRA